MPDPIRQSFFAYRSHPWPEVAGALSIIAERASELKALESAAINEIVAHVLALRDLFSSADTNNVFSGIFEREAIRSLDPGMLAAFLAAPTDEGIQTDLIFQLNMVCAASGRLPRLSATPSYAESELQDVLQGADYYNDMVFLHSLHDYAEGHKAKDVAEILYGTLAAKPLDLITETFSWDGALIYALILQIIWAGFKELPEDKQATLLTSYFYSGIVAGVPVRAWLQDTIIFAIANDKADAVSDFIGRAVTNNNNEVVPLNAKLSAVKGLHQILADYIAKLSTEKVATLAEEMFLASVYPATAGVEHLVNWLREVFSIILHLRQKDILS
ncbi:MAG: hypothetical protein Q7K39_04375 [Candidatus Magasanikbacteria bacterium]|nr:hypothetical protein [Candidatus Magasanikbacteria bacterium]